jgi:hypothetical protein
MAITRLNNNSITSITALPSGVPVGSTMADAWRITSSFTPTHDALTIITSGWGQDDETGYGRIGSSMSQSSGIFTFPSTGIYEVTFILTFQGNSDYYCGTVIQNTTNNSTYNRRNLSYAYQIHDGGGSSTGSVTTVKSLIDVTDTSNVKVRFGYNTNGASSIHGSTNEIATGAIFIRLGDT